MRGLLFAFLGLLFLAQTGRAADEGAAEVFLKNKLDSVVDVLQERDVEVKKKNEEVDAIASPMFDFALMAKLTLGKEHWPRFSQPEKDRFTELFIKRFKKTYLEKLTLYKDEKIVYEPAVQTEKKAEIPTYLVSKDNKTSIVYKLYKSEGVWKIYDVEIEGVSIIRSYRTQFSDILEKGTIGDLLSRLEESVEK